MTDRYEALGIKRPNKDSICLGKCEGTGWVPVHKDYLNRPDHKKFIELWRNAHKIERGQCDGWHFVKCPDCKGQGHLTTTLILDET